jgi:hypothetical protein
MFNNNKKDNTGLEDSPDQPISAPTVSLPKGGGAIRGIGEKFSANPVTGTGSLSVPVFTKAARSDFFPKLSLSYDSGAGNGPFGLGWNLSVPAVTRKTEKGLPRYADMSGDGLTDIADYVASAPVEFDPWEPLPTVSDSGMRSASKQLIPCPHGWCKPTSDDPFQTNACTRRREPKPNSEVTKKDFVGLSAFWQSINP